MNFYRYVLIVLEKEERKCEFLNEIPNWEYSDELEPIVRTSGYSFVLINQIENIQIFFKKIQDCVYTSINVLPYEINKQDEIGEPQSKNIHDDILFKLCMSIKKKYVNNEVRCGIIPCESDEI